MSSATAPAAPPLCSAKAGVQPFTGVTLAENLEAEDAAECRALGLEQIARSEVAVLLLAGGQGTRLGSDAPKGCYDIKMPSGKSLYQYHAEKIAAVKRLAAAHAGVGEAEVRLPFLVMTSSATDKSTRDFFAEHAYFGLPAEQVIFFEQDMLPCFGLDGKLLLAAPGRLALAPNGNGGVYLSLQRLGLLERLHADGVTAIFQFGVDNVLCHVAEPTFLGFCASRGAECGVKTVGKREPHEKVGVLAQAGGRTSVVEYSEISAKMAEARDADGQLLYGSAHICVNWFSVAFLRRFCNEMLDSLPLHVAKKKVDVCSEDGTAAVASGVKLELFIFDTFPAAAKVVALQVPREEEFAPVKNAPGSASESPDTARALYSRLCRRRALEAGALVAGGDGSDDADAPLLEISPLVSYAGEGLDYLAGKPLVPPLHIEKQSPWSCALL